MRGQAGTHDIELARQTLEQLKLATSESSEVAVVRYDKSAHEGRGDRAPDSKWQRVKGKVDVVLFEGWMLGFKPLTDQAAEKVIIFMLCFACCCACSITLLLKLWFGSGRQWMPCPCSIALTLVLKSRQYRHAMQAFHALCDRLGGPDQCHLAELFACVMSYAV